METEKDARISQLRKPFFFAAQGVWMLLDKRILCRAAHYEFRNSERGTLEKFLIIGDASRKLRVNHL